LNPPLIHGLGISKTEVIPDALVFGAWNAPYGSGCLGLFRVFTQPFRLSKTEFYEDLQRQPQTLRHTDAMDL